jgi:hypothetical protein
VGKKRYQPRVPYVKNAQDRFVGCKKGQAPKGGRADKKNEREVSIDDIKVARNRIVRSSSNVVVVVGW